MVSVYNNTLAIKEFHEDVLEVLSFVNDHDYIRQQLELLLLKGNSIYEGLKSALYKETSEEYIAESLLFVIQRKFEPVSKNDKLTE